MDDTAEATTDSTAPPERENIKNSILNKKTDGTTLLLSKEQKAALSNDPQKAAQYRADVAEHLPVPQNWVNDFDDLFTEKQETELNGIIANFEKESGVQIAVITLDTFCIAKANIQDAGLAIFNTWGIGTKEKNDGLLITIVKGYEYMRINTGSGTQQILSDQATDSILHAAFFPSLKGGNDYKGTITGLHALISYMRPNVGKIK